MNFQGKTAVVTGGSRGIGRAICLELAKGGANLVFCYAGNEAAAQQTAAECEQAAREAAQQSMAGCPEAGRVLAVKCDVSDAASVKALMDTAVQNFGRIDILVNNAGITRDGLLMRMKEEDFDAVIDTNLKGAYLCMQAVSTVMMKQRYGRVINISSVVGVHGNAGQMNYAASKAGLIGMTKSMAKELGSRGVTVNAIAPGFIETDMTESLNEAARKALLAAIPAQRLGKAQEVAKAAAFLAAEDSGYITGQVLGVDGGMGM